jgi:glycosyltransferase involved in cell wall biosynthesis
MGIETTGIKTFVSSNKILENISEGKAKSIGEKISVVLLTYNHVDVIESTLQSILDQTVTGYEIIVSDDCSTDGTWERLLEFAVRHPTVRVIRTPENLRMPGNANFAVAHASRLYIALLHHDDLYRKDLLEKWADVLERRADVGFVFNQYASDNPVHNSYFEHESMDGQWFLERILFARWGCPVRGTALIRKSLWDSLGGMREEFNLIADVDLWMRLAMISQVGYVQDPVIFVRELRPEYYPDSYTLKRFHWSRHTLLYAIHAANRLQHYGKKTIKGRLEWLKFRIRVSFHTAKWLSYAVMRKKRRREILAHANESITSYDLLPLRIYRGSLQLLFGRLVRAKTNSNDQ